MPNSRRSLPVEQREAGVARNPAHPPLLLAQVERPAPGGADLADEILGDRRGSSASLPSGVSAAKQHGVPLAIRCSA